MRDSEHTPMWVVGRYNSEISAMSTERCAGWRSHNDSQALRGMQGAEATMIVALMRETDFGAFCVL